MSQSATIQLRIDVKTKKQAQAAFAKMGLDLSSGIKLYLSQVAAEKALLFTPEIPNAKTVRALRRARKEARTARVFNSMEELIEDLRSGMK